MFFSSLLISATYPLLKCDPFEIRSAGFDSDFPLSTFDASGKFF